MSRMIVFPGQGSQFKGMGEGLFEKFPELVAIADRVLGYSIVELCLEDPQQCLNQTEYTQPALFFVSVLHYLDSEYFDSDSQQAKVDYIAGHSLGEYAALFAAGAFDLETGLKLVQKRGELMANAPKGAMAAVINLEYQQVKQLLDESEFKQLDLANINTSNQNVLSGEYSEIYAAADMFADAGGRYIPLKVSAAFHSRLMAPVAKAFAQFMGQFEFKPLKTPVIANLTARAYPQQDYTHLMVQQIDHSVKWHETVSWALSQGCEDITEVGPGMVLTKMTFAIKKSPLTKFEPVEPSKATTASSGDQAVFMFAGQGSHYKNMGRELYISDETFKGFFDQCAEIVAEQTGLSLVGELYHPSAADNFDDVRITHPTILCFEYALAMTLIESGIKPTAVIGHSLGEYVAAVIAGAMSIKQAITLVCKQAQLVHLHSEQGNIMVVLKSKSIFEQQSSDFSELYYGGQNYENCFIVSGEAQAMNNCADKLQQQQINYVKLPVNIAFHSPIIDGAASAFIEFAESFDYQPLQIPFYSCALGADSHNHELKAIDAKHLWQAVRGQVDFANVIKHYPGPAPMFIDLCATASLSSFIKYEFAQQHAHTYLINQFGHDNASMERAMIRLAQTSDNNNSEDLTCNMQ